VIKVTIDIDRWRDPKPPFRIQADDSQLWAHNYLVANGLLPASIHMKKSKRAEGLSLLLELKDQTTSVVSCNARGEVEFSWQNEQERLLFLMKWG